MISWGSNEFLFVTKWRQNETMITIKWLCYRISVKISILLYKLFVPSLYTMPHCNYLKHNMYIIGNETSWMIMKIEKWEPLRNVGKYSSSVLLGITISQLFNIVGCSNWILLNKSVNELQKCIHGEILITRWQKWKQIVTTMKFLSCHQWMISFFDWNKNEDRNKSQSIFILCNWYQIPMLRKKHNYLVSCCHPKVHKFI